MTSHDDIVMIKEFYRKDVDKNAWKVLLCKKKTRYFLECQLNGVTIGKPIIFMTLSVAEMYWKGILREAGQEEEYENG